MLIVNVIAKTSGQQAIKFLGGRVSKFIHGFDCIAGSAHLTPTLFKGNIYL